MVTKYFNKGVSMSSPVQKDYARVVKYDEHGSEYICFEEVDYPSLQESNGNVSLWQLDALLKAGINPNFPIHTGNNTRLEGIGVVHQAEAMADAILAEDSKSNE